MKRLMDILGAGIGLVLLSPLLATMLGLPSETLPVVMLSLLLGTPVLSLLGAIGTALTVGVRRGGALLALLLLPLYVPTLIFGAEAARRGAVGMQIETPLLLLAGISLGTIALLPFAAASALRMTIR